jgi:hypothetical protein
MKKYIIYLLLALCTFSCSKKDSKPLFDQSPDERLNEKLAAYQAQLSGSQNGWKALIKTDSGKGSAFSFYFKFDNANRVVMLSDFDSLSAVTPQESSYRLKALQQPSLIFDTYSYLHVLSDPDARANGGTFGAGLLSDFEFYFDSVSTDTIKLVGRIHGSKMVMVSATPDEAAAYNGGQLAAGLYINKILTYFKRLTIGSQLYDIKIDPVNRVFIFSWLDAGGNLQTFTTHYYFIAGGLIFTSPLINGTEIVSGFENLAWNPATQTISLTAGGVAATITGIVIPLKVDVDAPHRWWQFALDNGNSFWVSSAGFHVNGIDDAFGINTLPRYYFLAYWPEYDPGNDLFAPIFLNAAGTGLEIQYATGPATPTFTADGRAIFQQMFVYGTYPASGPAALSRTLLYNPAGYYFVQTGETTYDMVSASDGKSWITWEF